MPRKIALKKLSASDLTLFEWHFRHHNAGNQKAINLNADVFIDVLYPELPNTPEGRQGKFGVDLYIYGPDTAPELNLQRKIIKTETYKNWRLNGEFVLSPMEAPDRFNCLVAGDVALLEFFGDIYPGAVRMVLISSKAPRDRALHDYLSSCLRGKSMIPLDGDVIEEAIKRTSPAENHPIIEFALEESLEDAAQGGLEGIQALARRRSGRAMSAKDLQRAKEHADFIGELGEELVNEWLSREQANGRIAEFEWSSRANAVSPFDFAVHSKSATRHLEVKSTSGPFGRSMHLSIAQVHEMAKGGFEIWRVYEINAKTRTAEVRRCVDTKAIAERILATMAALPKGVQSDSVSIKPAALKFGPALKLRTK